MLIQSRTLALLFYPGRQVRRVNRRRPGWRLRKLSARLKSFLG